MYIHQHVIESDERYGAPIEDEILNNIFLSYQTDNERLNRLKEEYEQLATVAENLMYLKCREKLSALLEQEQEAIIGLEDNTQLLRERLRNNGIEVA